MQANRLRFFILVLRVFRDFTSFSPVRLLLSEQVPDRNFHRGISYYNRTDALRDEYIGMVFDQADDELFRTRWNDAPGGHA